MNERTALRKQIIKQSNRSECNIQNKFDVDVDGLNGSANGGTTKKKFLIFFSLSFICFFVIFRGCVCVKVSEYFLSFDELPLIKFERQNRTKIIRKRQKLKSHFCDEVLTHRRFYFQGFIFRIGSNTMTPNHYAFLQNDKTIDRLNEEKRCGIRTLDITRVTY